MINLPDWAKAFDLLIARKKSNCYGLEKHCNGCNVLKSNYTNIFIIQELHASFTGLLDRIFGFNGCPGWGLHTLTQYNQEDFRVLHKFLEPKNGPLFHMVYKLQADNYLRYEFPIAALPVSILFTLIIHILYLVASKLIGKTFVQHVKNLCTGCIPMI